MTTRLYYVPLPDAQTTTIDEGVTSSLSIQGLLEGGQFNVEPIATESADLTIDGQFRAGSIFSQKLSKELESVGEGPYTDLPLFDDGQTPGTKRGYYEIESVDVSPAHASTQNTFEYTVALTAAGTRSTKWRTVDTTPSDASHPFGNDQSILIGAPSQARKVKWYNPDAGNQEEAQTAETRNAEFGDVDIYDITDSSYDEPSLVFELDYEREGKVDVKAYDDRGGDKFAEYDDSDGTTHQINQWTHVFHEAFDYEGERILDNGLLRLRLDEPNHTIEVWEWNDSGGSWDSLSLGDSDWELLDADIRGLGPASIDAVVEFQDTTQSPTAYYNIRMALKRGWSYPLWSEISGEGGVPSGLTTLLDPIASSSAYDPGESQGLRQRSDL